MNDKISVYTFFRIEKAKTRLTIRDISSILYAKERKKICDLKN